MRGLRTALVLGVLAALAWAAVLAAGPGQPAVGDAAVSGPLVPGLAARFDTVQQIVVTRGEIRFTVRRGAEGDWRLAEFGDYPAVQAGPDRLLAGVAALQRVGPRTSRPDRYALLGVTAPGAGSDAVGLSLLDAAARPLADLVIGGAQRAGVWIGQPGRYVRLGADPQVWLAAGAIDLPAAAEDWLNQPLADISRHRVNRIEMAGEGRVPLVWTRARLGEPLLPADATAARLPDADLQALARALEGLAVRAARPQAELDGTTVLRRLSVSTFDGLTLRLRLHPPAEAPWLTAEIRFAPVATPVSPADRAEFDLQDPAETGREALRLLSATAGFAVRPAPDAAALLIPDWP